MHERVAGQRRAVTKVKAHLRDTRKYVRSVLDSLVETEVSKKIRFNRFSSRKKLEDEPVTIRFDVPSSRSILDIFFVGDLPKSYNAALAAVRYIDESNNPIPGPYDGFVTSDKVGEYVYLNPDSHGKSSVNLVAPTSAKRIELSLRTWKTTSPIYIMAAANLRWNEDDEAITRLKKALWHMDAISKLTDTIRPMSSQTGPIVLSALDEISNLNWSREFNLQKLDRKQYATQIEVLQPAFLLLESAWKANGGDWEYAFLSPGLQHANAKAMVDAIEVAKSANVPVIFWNKEDPLHYDKFLPIAEKADIIFTTDINCVDRYKADTTSKVEVMPFAANLAVTNPVGRYREDNGTVCFAGGWYSVGHDERTRQMNYMLEPILEHGGVIYDRHSIHNNDRYAYPERFKNHIRPAVSFAEMTKLYRGFKVFLNVNTIINSETMMSRRVYELLASGTPVVSAPSAAIEAQFDGIVKTASTAKEANFAVGELLADDVLWRKTSHRGVREVVSKHQYKHRSDLITQMVSGRPPARPEPLVSIVMSTRRQNFVDRIVENLSRQRGVRFDLHFALSEEWTDENIGKLHSILEANSFARRINVSRHTNAELLGDKLNNLISQTRGDFVSKFDDDDFYFENYLSDIIASFELGDFDIVGKHSHPIYMESDDCLIWKAPHKRSVENDHVSGATITARRSLFNSFSFPSRRQGEDTNFLASIKAAGGRIYSSDEFNFIQYRAASADQHTWRADEDVFRRMGSKVGTSADFGDWIV